MSAHGQPPASGKAGIIVPDQTGVLYVLFNSTP
jgi:hypothetical protein